MVSVIILWDDEPPVLDHLLWPQGAGCIDLQDHYSHAVDALYPQDGDVDQDDRLQDFLLMKDLITAQRAGAHSVSVTVRAALSTSSFHRMQ